jgi:restriction system protein
VAVPDYQRVMLPLVQLASDECEHSLSDVIDTLAQDFRLSQEERVELLPSGRQARFDNRVAWAVTYLSKAGLLQRTGRARFRITPRGLEVVRSQPGRLDRAYLTQFSEFRDFQRASQPTPPNGALVPQEDEHGGQTPEESLDAIYLSLRAKTAQELLERILTGSPRFFEKLVVDLLVAMGYGGSRKDAGQAIGGSGDGGVDGIIKEDRLGLDVVHVQAKRWRETVGRPTIQAFAGSLKGYRAKKGVLITTSQFSQEAKNDVNGIEKKIVLIDGDQLVQLMMDYGVGTSDVITYTVKKVDLDYFEDGQ